MPGLIWFHTVLLSHGFSDIFCFLKKKLTLKTLSKRKKAYKKELFFLQKQMSPPPFLVLERSECWQMKFLSEIMVVCLVKYQFHIQERYQANTVNYCKTNPSFGEKVISIYYFHYNK